jgi:hypothetical protein
MHNDGFSIRRASQVVLDARTVKKTWKPAKPAHRLAFIGW